MTEKVLPRYAKPIASGFAALLRALPSRSFSGLLSAGYIGDPIASMFAPARLSSKGDLSSSNNSMFVLFVFFVVNNSSAFGRFFRN